MYLLELLDYTSDQLVVACVEKQKRRPGGRRSLLL
jgi:hypothetical protein